MHIQVTQSVSRCPSRPETVFLQQRRITTFGQQRKNCLPSNKYALVCSLLGKAGSLGPPEEKNSPLEISSRGKKTFLSLFIQRKKWPKWPKKVKLLAMKIRRHFKIPITSLQIWHISLTYSRGVFPFCPVDGCLAAAAAAAAVTKCSEKGPSPDFQTTRYFR